MKARLTAAASVGVAVLVVLASGCGTIATISQAKPEENLIYSGTRFETSSELAVVHTFPDLPLSVAADTLALPYTIPHSLSGRRGHNSPSTQPSSDPEPSE